MSTPTRKQHAKRALDELLRRYAGRLTFARDNFWRLIEAVRGQSRMLIPLPGYGWNDPDNTARVIRACSRMAQRPNAWLRYPEQWIAPAGSPLVQFRSLVSHLFDEYCVPNFMAPLWLSEGEHEWELDLYLHLAAGKSIRNFEFPLLYPGRMNKRTAQYFVQAPDDAHPLWAYRWAHVRSLGGDAHLARLLMGSASLLAPTSDEKFWESVIRFLIKNLPIADKDVLDIVWFIDQQKFRPAERVWGPGAGEQPLQPDFSMRGRSLRTLRRHMANWKIELPIPAGLAPDKCGWKRSSIGPFRAEQGSLLWTIDEILSDRELRAEGGIMQHCAGIYVQQCAQRQTTIWSMKRHEGDKRKRALTIEVLPYSRTIWQARGKRNSLPSEIENEMLYRWAEQEGLTFA